MIYFFLVSLFFSTPILSFTIYTPLDINSRGKVPSFEWNAQTPLAVDIENGEKYQLSILKNNLTIDLTKKISKDFENKDHYIFSVHDLSLLSNTTELTLQIVNTQKKWPFNTSKTKITINTNSPLLEMLSISDTVTHGGAGLVVVQSEKKEDLSFLAVMDERGIPFYPRIFKKDGFYSILFPWYSDYSKDWGEKYILAIDSAGNHTKIPLDTNPLNRSYRQRVITLPPDYAAQKAKELVLDAKDAKKLEGDINAINAQLAKQVTFNRWVETRTSFDESTKKIIKSPEFFSQPSMPMSNAITTAYYGDKRRYYYQNKVVRQSVHRGHDYASYPNTPIYALLDGTVVHGDWYGGNGKTVVLDHGMHVYSMYAHNKEILVKKGQKIKAGTQISISGTTGQSTGDHLHLSIFVQGMYIEPKEWLKYDSIDKLFHKPLREAEKIIRTL